VKPGFKQDPINLRDLFIRSGMAAPTTGVVAGGTASSGVGRSSTATAPAPSTSSPSSSGTTAGAFSGGPTPSSMVYQNGNQVPLNTFTHLESTTAPIAINHQGQFPVVTISFNLAPNASLVEAVKAVNRAKDEIGVPASIQGQFQGTAAAFQASLVNEPMLILAAIVTVYIVLGVLYESYIHPITILSTLPSA